jgi:hypothetical protein
VCCATIFSKEFLCLGLAVRILLLSVRHSPLVAEKARGGFVMESKEM